MYKPFMMTDNNCSDINDPRLVAENDKKAESFTPILAILTFLVVIGVIGNSLVCYIYFFKFKRTSANCFIIWLAVLDLNNCFVGIPFEMLDLLQPYRFNWNYACKIMRFWSSVTVIASGLTLVAVAFDRYYKIAKPLRRFPNRTAKILNGCSLLFGLIMSLPALFVFGIKSDTINITDYDTNVTVGLKSCECSIDPYLHKEGSKLPLAYYGILGLLFLVCVSSFVILYGRLGHMIFARNRAIVGASVEEKHSTRKESDSDGLVRSASVASSQRSVAANGAVAVATTERPVLVRQDGFDIESGDRSPNILDYDRKDTLEDKHAVEKLIAHDRIMRNDIELAADNHVTDSREKLTKSQRSGSNDSKLQSVMKNGASRDTLNSLGNNSPRDSVHFDDKLVCVEPCLHKACRPKSQVKRNMSKQETQQRHTGLQRDRQRSRTGSITIRTGRVTSIFICVSIVFVVSFLPYVVAKIYRENYKDFTTPTYELVYNFAARSFFLNSASNPIIYSFLNENFRVQCVILLKKLRRCRWT